MRLILEEAAPFERSVAWRLHHAYWEQRGAAAWTSGEVPSHATTNRAAARQKVRLFLALVADLVAAGELLDDDPVWVLEAGAGSGVFARNFLAALDAEPDAADVARRTRFIASDYAEKNLRDLRAQPAVAALVEAGRLVLARWDMTAPHRLRELDGGPVTRPITLVLASYVACVLPMKYLQRSAAGEWRELRVTIAAELDGAAPTTPDAYLDALTADATRAALLEKLDFTYAFAPTTLADALPDPLHAATVERALRGLGAATLGYPVLYVDFLRGVEALLVRGGAVVTTDYGSANRLPLVGEVERPPQRYGNSLAQEVSFPTLEAFAKVAGWDCLRTKSELATSHTAAMTPWRFGDATRGVFGAVFPYVCESDHLLDFVSAARRYARERSFARAVRFFLLAVALDPDNAELRAQLAEAAIEAGVPRLAREQLLVGLELDPTAADFEFMIGRALAHEGKREDAVAWYERSLAREAHPTTWANLAEIHATAGRKEEARRCYEAALALDPEHGDARERLAELDAGGDGG
ncbi:MAG: tetratricopeptide repeat protein [Deltaproteobacteria bacterium]|nr:tetratricopeptide repeat protein [Deltaproteobacteria bacterium]